MQITREQIADRLAAVGYVADRDIATALWLMDFLKRPLLLEGEAGVGKTEVAKALAAVQVRHASCGIWMCVAPKNLKASLTALEKHGTPPTFGLSPMPLAPIG